MGKAAGDEQALISGRGSCWQIERASGAVPDVAGGEVVTSAARPDRVMHKYRGNPVVSLYVPVKEVAENSGLSTSPPGRCTWPL
jgi:hypothetical protein